MVEFESGLEKYVEQQRLPLIAKSVLGARSISLLNLQTGVKGTAALNLLDTTVKFGDGATCGWNEAGASKFTQRQIEAVPLKVNMEFCDKAMLKAWTQSQVKVAANPDKALPFEEEFVKGVIDGVNANIEKMIWQGTGTTDSVMGETFKGLLTIAGGDGKVIKATATGVEATVKAVYEAIPAKLLNHKGLAIAMGSDAFRTYVQALVDKNLTNYATTMGEGMEIILPGTNIRVIGLDGMIGSKKVFAADFDTVFYGTDLEGDEETFDLWYSRDERQFRLAIDLVAGVQYAFSDEIVLGTIGDAAA